MPPFGHTTQLRVFVDPDLLQYDEVWATAGTWNDNFGAAPAEIVRVAGGVVTDLKRSATGKTLEKLSTYFSRMKQNSFPSGSLMT